MTLSEALARLRDALSINTRLRQNRDMWKARAELCEARRSLPGRKTWTPRVERWRGMVVYYCNLYARKHLGRDASDWEVDMFLGVISGE